MSVAGLLHKRVQTGSTTPSRISRAVTKALKDKEMRGYQGRVLKKHAKKDGLQSGSCNKRRQVWREGSRSATRSWRHTNKPGGRGANIPRKTLNNKGGNNRWINKGMFANCCRSYQINWCWILMGFLYNISICMAIMKNHIHIHSCRDVNSVHLTLACAWNHTFGAMISTSWLCSPRSYDSLWTPCWIKHQVLTY